MSLEKKDVHVRLEESIHSRLSVLAGLDNDGIAEHAAYLLEKMIIAEYHTVTVQLERMERLGLTGKIREKQG